MRTDTSTASLKTCKWCHADGFVWYRTKADRWVLTSPKPGTFDPDPRAVHRCVYAPSKVNQRSHKAGTWKRGRSPSSYR